MHDHGNSDDAVQSAVLGLVLAEHPALLASDEVEREMGDQEAVERALRDLTGAGLLRREGATVLPTRAALAFDQLDA